ncbi:MAG: hypothetical protein ONB23_06090 [candidate division KSB1 bacterium]|nr:hypothetical protein [candidate division KSB1 bacterium]
MIRPLDLADSIAKAPYADRVNQLQRRNPDTEQQTFHMQWVERAAQEQSRPRKTEEEEPVRNDQEERQNQAEEPDEAEQRAAEGEAESSTPQEDGLGQVLDVLA